MTPFASVGDSCSQGHAMEQGHRMEPLLCHRTSTLKSPAAWLSAKHEHTHSHISLGEVPQRSFSLPLRQAAMQGQGQHAFCSQQLCHLIAPLLALHKDDSEGHCLAAAFRLLGFQQQQPCYIVYFGFVCCLLKGLSNICCGCADLANLYSNIGKVLLV